MTRRNTTRYQYYKNNFGIIQQRYNYGKVLMHDLRCLVSFQVDIVAPASKDLFIIVLMVHICGCKLILCLNLAEHLSQLYYTKLLF